MSAKQAAILLQLLNNTLTEAAAKGSVNGEGVSSTVLKIYCSLVSIEFLTSFKEICFTEFGVMCLQPTLQLVSN